MSGEYNIRQRLRHRLLSELYAHYFEKGGAPLIISKNKMDEDKEVDLAYNYLLHKDLITASEQGNNYYLKPTVRGIDLVENSKPQ
jgi:hypothetical protein